jgi:membrane fusion protein (multidrug efflux system)
MNKKTKIILFSIIGVLILGIIFYPKVISMFKTEDELEVQTEVQPQEKQQALHVNAMVLTPQKLTDVFRTKGQLLPDEEVDLSFETSGKITDILFKEGTSVKKGTLLAKVNDQPLQAELKKLEAQIPLAQERVNRQRTLLDKDAVSQEAYQAVTTDLDKLMADIELVKAKIQQSELRAPFDGVIGLRWVSEGAFASTGTVVARLTKISPLKIEFSVNERHANNIHPGTVISFTVEGDKTVYRASVYAIETTLDEKTLSLKARALYHNPQGKLRPGRSASIEIVLREIENAVVAPGISILAEMGRDLAYIYKNGKAKQVQIKKGMRTSSTVQITEGLQVGDTLLVTGVMQLRDGTNVIINRMVDNDENAED